MDQFIDVDLLLSNETLLCFHYLVCTVQNHQFILFFADLLHRLLSQTALNHNLVEFQLDSLPTNNLLLDRVLYN